MADMNPQTKTYETGITVTEQQGLPIQEPLPTDTIESTVGQQEVAQPLVTQTEGYSPMDGQLQQLFTDLDIKQQDINYEFGAYVVEPNKGIYNNALTTIYQRTNYNQADSFLNEFVGDKVGTSITKELLKEGTLKNAANRFISENFELDNSGQQALETIINEGDEMAASLVEGFSESDKVKFSHYLAQQALDQYNNKHNYQGLGHEVKDFIDTSAGVIHNAVSNTASSLVSLGSLGLSVTPLADIPGAKEFFADVADNFGHGQKILELDEDAFLKEDANTDNAEIVAQNFLSFVGELVVPLGAASKAGKAFTLGQKALKLQLLKSGLKPTYKNIARVLKDSPKLAATLQMTKNVVDFTARAGTTEAMAVGMTFSKTSDVYQELLMGGIFPQMKLEKDKDGNLKYNFQNIRTTMLDNIPVAVAAEGAVLPALGNAYKVLKNMGADEARYLFAMDEAIHADAAHKAVANSNVPPEVKEANFQKLKTALSESEIGKITDIVPKLDGVELEQLPPHIREVFTRTAEYNTRQEELLTRMVKDSEKYTSSQMNETVNELVSNAHEFSEYIRKGGVGAVSNNTNKFEKATFKIAKKELLARVGDQKELLKKEIDKFTKADTPEEIINTISNLKQEASSLKSEVDTLNKKINNEKMMREKGERFATFEDYADKLSNEEMTAIKTQTTQELLGKEYKNGLTNVADLDRAIEVAKGRVQNPKYLNNIEEWSKNLALLQSAKGKLADVPLTVPQKPGTRNIDLKPLNGELQSKVRKLDNINAKISEIDNALDSVDNIPVDAYGNLLTSEYVVKVGDKTYTQGVLFDLVERQPDALEKASDSTYRGTPFENAFDIEPTGNVNDTLIEIEVHEAIDNAHIRGDSKDVVVNKVTAKADSPFLDEGIRRELGKLNKEIDAAFSINGKTFSQSIREFNQQLFELVPDEMKPRFTPLSDEVVAKRLAEKKSKKLGQARLEKYVDKFKEFEVIGPDGKVNYREGKSIHNAFKAIAKSEVQRKEPFSVIVEDFTSTIRAFNDKYKAEHGISYFEDSKFQNVGQLHELAQRLGNDKEDLLRVLKEGSGDLDDVIAKNLGLHYLDDALSTNINQPIRKLLETEFGSIDDFRKGMKQVIAATYDKIALAQELTPAARKIAAINNIDHTALDDIIRLVSSDAYKKADEVPLQEVAAVLLNKHGDELVDGPTQAALSRLQNTTTEATLGDVHKFNLLNTLNEGMLDNHHIHKLKGRARQLIADADYTLPNTLQYGTDREAMFLAGASVKGVISSAMELGVASLVGSMKVAKTALFGTASTSLGKFSSNVLGSLGSVMEKGIRGRDTSIAIQELFHNTSALGELIKSGILGMDVPKLLATGFNPSSSNLARITSEALQFGADGFHTMSSESVKAYNAVSKIARMHGDIGASEFYERVATLQNTLHKSFGFGISFIDLYNKNVIENVYKSMEAERFVLDEGINPLKNPALFFERKNWHLKNNQEVVTNSMGKAMRVAQETAMMSPLPKFKPNESFLTSANQEGTFIAAGRWVTTAVDNVAGRSLDNSFIASFGRDMVQNATRFTTLFNRTAFNSLDAIASYNPLINRGLSRAGREAVQTGAAVRGGAVDNASLVRAEQAYVEYLGRTIMGIGSTAALAYYSYPLIEGQFIRPRDLDEFKGADIKGKAQYKDEIEIFGVPVDAKAVPPLTLAVQGAILIDRWREREEEARNILQSEGVLDKIENPEERQKAIQTRHFNMLMEDLGRLANGVLFEDINHYQENVGGDTPLKIAELVYKPIAPAVEAYMEGDLNIFTENMHPMIKDILLVNKGADMKDIVSEEPQAYTSKGELEQLNPIDLVRRASRRSLMGLEDSSLNSIRYDTFGNPKTLSALNLDRPNPLYREMLSVMDYHGDNFKAYYFKPDKFTTNTGDSWNVEQVYLKGRNGELTNLSWIKASELKTHTKRDPIGAFYTESEKGELSKLLGKPIDGDLTLEETMLALTHTIEFNTAPVGEVDSNGIAKRVSTSTLISLDPLSNEYVENPITSKAEMLGGMALIYNDEIDLKINETILRGQNEDFLLLKIGGKKELVRTSVGKEYLMGTEDLDALERQTLQQQSIPFEQAQAYSVDNTNLPSL